MACRMSYENVLLIIYSVEMKEINRFFQKKHLLIQILNTCRVLMWNGLVRGVSIFWCRSSGCFLLTAPIFTATKGVQESHLQLLMAKSTALTVLGTDRWKYNVITPLGFSVPALVSSRQNHKSVLQFSLLLGFIAAVESAVIRAD